MKKFNHFLEDVKQLEKSLFGLVLSSFVFSLIAVLAQYKSFDIAFKALTELVGGVLGAAGVLSAYLGSLHHPNKHVSYLLEWEPKHEGMKAATSFLIVAVLFVAFYLLARVENKACLVFLGIGTFVFFRTIAVAVVVMRRSNQQTDFWNNMNKEARVRWLKNKFLYEQRMSKIQQDMEDFIRSCEESSREMRESTEEITRMLREEKIQNRKRKWSYHFEKFHFLTIHLRKSIAGDHLLTDDEKLKLYERKVEKEKLLDELFESISQKEHQENMQNHQ